MLSIPHLIIIFIVALVVFGPEKLPELARTLGKVMGEFRRATGDLRSTFEDHMRELEREAETRRIAAPKAPPQPTSAVTTAPSTPQPAGTVPAAAPNAAERSGSSESGVAASNSATTANDARYSDPKSDESETHPENASTDLSRN